MTRVSVFARIVRIIEEYHGNHKVSVGCIASSTFHSFPKDFSLLSTFPLLISKMNYAAASNKISLDLFVCL